MTISSARSALLLSYATLTLNFYHFNHARATTAPILPSPTPSNTRSSRPFPCLSTRKKPITTTAHARKNSSSWWRRFFSDDDPWFFFTDDVETERLEEEESEQAKFEAWKRKAEAITELREAQEDARNTDTRAWEDWLHPPASSWQQDDDDGEQDDPSSTLLKEKGVVQLIRDLLTGGRRQDEDDQQDDDLLFEDRVFNYASINSAKFIVVLILVPWALDFLIHDYVLMPFLDRYVKLVPLAAEMLDVRRSQKLEMVKTLKTERARFRFEVEIGKSPPLSDDEFRLELRHKALELRDEWRLENRRAFANIWSDMVYGIALFLLIYLNKSQVALLKFTGYKLFNNISDTGKAFLIILVTDIFLGYHSESGWQALIEIILERYGLQGDQAAITIFICSFPVVIDACVKLWLFKFLPRLSPNVTNIFREMKRH